MTKLLFKLCVWCTLVLDKNFIVDIVGWWCCFVLEACWWHHWVIWQHSRHSSCFVPLCPEVSIAAFSWAVCQSCHSLVANTKTLAHCMNTWDWIMLTQREKSNNFLHSAQTKCNIYSSWSLTKYLLDANFLGKKCASRFYIWVWHFHTKTFLHASGPVNQSLYALCFRVVRPFFSCERDILGTPCGNFFKLPQTSTWSQGWFVFKWRLHISYWKLFIHEWFFYRSLLVVD